MTRHAVAILFFGLAVACESSQTAVSTPTPPTFHPTPTSAPVPVGVAEPFTLYTHCGVIYADFDGKAFYADPILAGPPGQWGNPVDTGTMTLENQDTALFTDAAGNRATFSTHPKAGIPVIGICA